VWRAVVCLMLVALWVIEPLAFAAAGFHGQVTFNGLPVPGATVTATQGDKKETAITDQQGAYTFADLADGTWKFQVEMSGFAAQTQDVTVADGAAGLTWELKLLTLADITHGAAPVTAQNEQPAAAPGAANAPAPPATSANATGTPPKPNAPRAAANSANTPPATPPTASDANVPSEDASSDLQQSAATGLVVNGSVNNGAASPFAQMAAFGNNRRGPGLLYNGGAGVSFDTSAWDARNFSPGIATAKPSYNDVTILSSIGGPIGIPRHILSGSQFFVGFQHAATDNVATASNIVPTALERSGNFSQTLNALGQPVQIFNPATNTLFANNTVPVSPQAQALLNQYPLPNVTGVNGINYERSGVVAQQSDGLQVRLTKSIKNKNQIFGNLGYQRQSGQSDANIFGYQDASKSSGIDTAVNWNRIFRPGGVGYFTTLFKYEFNRYATTENPFFANRANISGSAGIQGNDQTPVNWGPPSLDFQSVASLGDPEYARNANDTQTFTYQSLWYRGKHTLQFGGDVLRLQFNTFSQQDGRGTFSFDSAATQQIANGQPAPGTGSDLADFVLGVPDTAEIAYGNADKYLRGWRYDAYFVDDWRMKAGFTVNLGLRWEFAQPLTELKNRLANLDVTSGFTTVAPVVATNPEGSITHSTYANSLLNSDHRGIEPRLGIAWRPRSNSPLIIRAGYGISDITSVYQVVTTQMAQQPPFSKTFDLTNSAALPLTLATAFNSPSGVPTFGVDPNFRVGYVQAWNASVQQDLPGSLVMTATYSGTKGSHLMQEYLPNTYPFGGANTCPTCPSGFVYLSSNGDSTREAGQIQLRRRLRNGLTSTLQYTYARALDDASAFSSASLGTPGGPALSSSPSSSTSSGVSIAQNWLNLKGERGRSPFDQRHLLSFTLQYTTGEGLHAGALMSGWRGTAFKDWTFQVSSLTFGTGLPLTPVYETSATGIAGVLHVYRPNVTGASLTAAPAGKHLNSAAFSAPAPGQWGDAGRDSITGPAQFGFSASFSRTFRLGSRVDATWETDASNVLNTVTATSWNTQWNSAAFGVPSSWNTMRKLTTTVRVRF
jgi:hypothetical protein